VKTAQRSFPLVGAVSGPTVLSDDEVAQYRTYEDALRASVRTYSRSHIKQRDLAEIIGMKAPQFSKILLGRDADERPAHLPGYARPLLMEATGNLLVAQWELAQVGYGVHALDDVRAENARLRARLAELERRVA